MLVRTLLMLLGVVSAYGSTPLLQTPAQSIHAIEASDVLCDVESNDGLYKSPQGITAEKVISNRGAVGYCQIKHTTALRAKCMGIDPAPLFFIGTNKEISTCVVAWKMRRINSWIAKGRLPRNMSSATYFRVLANYYHSGYIRLPSRFDKYREEAILRWRARRMQTWKVGLNPTLAGTL